MNCVDFTTIGTIVIVFCVEVNFTGLSEKRSAGGFVPFPVDNLLPDDVI
jgi:hypothetical protein